MNALDSQRIEFPCTHCGRKLSETVRKIKTNPAIRCAGCGQVHQVDARQFASQIKQVEQALAKLQRALGGLR